MARAMITAGARSRPVYGRLFGSLLVVELVELAVVVVVLAVVAVGVTAVVVDELGDVVGVEVVPPPL